jgi:methylglutamate dehydrogenase subunit A
MGERYSVWSLLKHAMGGHKGWERAWRDPEPKKTYDVVIIGGGGHGLATAYYLAKNHGVRNIAILEKGYIGSGNVGRNTTIVRSNYMMQDNTAFYEHSMSLWRGLSEDLNYNVMFSPRGYLFAACSQAALDGLIRRTNIMRLNGIRAEILTREEVMKEAPYLDFSEQARFPIYGGMLQPDAGTARHDAVAWGYARAADQLGVDIIQNCEVLDYIWSGDSIVGVKTTRGDIGAGKVAVAVAGHTSVLAQKAGLRLPIESHVPLSVSPSNPSSTTSSSGPPLIFTCPNPTRADWCLVVIWTATTATPSAATCPTWPRPRRVWSASSRLQRACGCFATGAASWT